MTVKKVYRFKVDIEGIAFKCGNGACITVPVEFLGKKYRGTIEIID